MHLTALAFAPMAVFFFATGCQQPAVSPSAATKAPRPVASSEAFAPSPRLIVGRVLSTDPLRSFAIVELTHDAPAAALGAETELLTRTSGLQETGRLQVSRYRRGRTLGTIILTGEPTPGDEVVWHAP